MSDPLDLPLSAEGLKTLQKAGVISAETRHTVQDWELTPQKLTHDADRFLLSLGSLLTLAGVIFLLALNWDSMGALIQLALPQILIAGCSYLIWKKGLQKQSGRIALFSASLFVGVWLAIHGLVFKSGEDVLFLFLSWAALIAPWVLASRFAPLWLLWLLILDATLGRYLSLDHFLRYLWWRDDGVFAWLAIGALNSAALFLRERAVARGNLWLSARWTRLTVLFTVLWALSFAIFFSLGKTQFLMISALALAIAVILMLRAYRRQFPEFMALAMIVLDACVMLVVLMIRGLIEITDSLHWHNRDSVMACFAFGGLFTIGIFTWGTFWLKNVHAEMQRPKEMQDEPIENDVQTGA